MRILFQFASVVLTPVIAATPMWSQSPLPAPSAEIRLHVVGSDGKEAAVGSRSTKGFAIQVTDETGAGVPDAAVVLRLPEEEPTGSFADGTHSAVAYTSQNGGVEISGIKWGSMPGAVTIKVTATKGDAHAGMLIDEKLSPATPVSIAPAEPKPELKAEKSLSAEIPAVPARSAQPPVAQTPVERSHVIVRQPGVPEADKHSAVRSTAATAGSTEPTVSVINGKTHEKLSNGGHKKWIILLALVAAGAGAGVALGSKSKASTASAPSTVSVGSPSVSIGKP